MLEQVVKLFVIVFLNGLYLFPHPAEFVDLIIGLLLKLTNLDFQIFHAEFVQHDDVMVPVVGEQTLKANAAQTVLAKGFDVFQSVDFALAVGRIRLVVREHAVAHLIGILAIVLANLATVYELHVVLVVVLVGCLDGLGIVIFFGSLTLLVASMILVSLHFV